MAVLLAGPPVQAQSALPPAVAEALQRANLPTDALAGLVVPLHGPALLGPRWQHQADRAMQPASTMKLVTTAVALDRLGPNLRGYTEVWTRAPLLPAPAATQLLPADGGVLQGDLVLRGGADPELGLPQLWALLAELRWQGIREIAGDIVLDRHLFRPARPDLGAPPFDEQPEFPYNLIPDALQLGGSLMGIELRADGQQVQARALPPLPGVVIDASALRLTDRACRDWDDDWVSPPRVSVDDPAPAVGAVPVSATAPAAGAADPAPATGAAEPVLPTLRVQLQGGFSRHCTARPSLQLIDRNALAERQLRWVWQQLGGRWTGRLREAESSPLPPPRPLPAPLANLLPVAVGTAAGTGAGVASVAGAGVAAGAPAVVAPAAAAPAASGVSAAAPSAAVPSVSPPWRLLARRDARPWGELLRTLNKQSDNVLTRLLFLQLGVNAMAEAPGQTTAELAAREVRRWMAEQGIGTDGVVLDNGSGLSRSERIAPRQLVGVLRAAQRSRWASEMLMGIPLVGIDGTMRNRLRASLAGGSARLKTGTLRNTTALAGYVTDPQGRVYVLAAMVNHDQAAAGRPALDALVDWVASGGLTGRPVTRAPARR